MSPVGGAGSPGGREFFFVPSAQFNTLLAHIDGTDILQLSFGIRQGFAVSQETLQEHQPALLRRCVKLPPGLVAEKLSVMQALDIDTEAPSPAPAALAAIPLQDDGPAGRSQPGTPRSLSSISMKGSSADDEEDFDDSEGENDRREAAKHGTGEKRKAGYAVQAVKNTED